MAEGWQAPGSFGCLLTGRSFAWNWGRGAAPAMSSKRHRSERVLRVPVHNCGAQGKLHLLWDIWLVLSDRGCLALHKLLGPRLGQSLLPALQEHTGSPTRQLSSSTAAAARHSVKPLTPVLLSALVNFHKCLNVWQTPWIPCHDSTGEPGTEERHSPYISATAEVIREISVKETSRASPPHSAHASWKREDRAEREQKSHGCGFLPTNGAQCSGCCHPSSRDKPPSLLPARALSGLLAGPACRMFLVSSPTLKCERSPSYRVAKINMEQVSLSWIRHQLVPTGAALCTSQTAPALH